MSLVPFVFYLTHRALVAINQFYGFVNQTALMGSHVSPHLSAKAKPLCIEIAKSTAVE